MSTAAVAASYFYVAKYVYAEQVTENDNLLRVMPASDAFQAPRWHEVASRPSGSNVEFRDRFDNAVQRVKVVEPHREFVIAAAGELDICSRDEEVADAPLLGPSPAPDVELYLQRSPLVDPAEVAAAADVIVPRSATLLEAVSTVVAWVHNNVDYQRGFTSVHSQCHEVLALRRGVCQDMAHLAIGMLRSLGVASRYVSGLIAEERGETHAWLEFLHPQEGWLPADPTHNVVVALGAKYVKFGAGRDYSDVPPLQGAFTSVANGRLLRVRTALRLRGNGASVEEAIAIIDEEIDEAAAS
jgi:transglutaminase-like putative cysteine protease